MNHIERKHPPAIKRTEDFTFLKVKTSYLSNGIPFHLMNYGEQELMRVQFVFPGGGVYQKKSMTASSVNDLLMEGTDQLSAEEIATRIENTGAFIDSDFNNDYAWLSLYCLTGKDYAEQVEELLSLVKEVLFKATFPDDEFLTYMRIKFQEFQVNSQKVSFLARNSFLPFLLGKEHAYAHQISHKDFKHIKRADLISFYEENYQNANMEIFISGKISDTILSMIKSSFEVLKFKQKEVKNELPLIVSPPEEQEKLIPVENAVQSAIRIGRVSINRSHPDYVSLYVANTILGGYFGSRLMANIREDKGYTYGINSLLVSSKHLDYFVIATEVGVQHTIECIDEIKKEIEKMSRDLVDSKELELVKNYLNGRILKSFDGAFSAMDRFRYLSTLGLDYTFYDKLIKGIQLLTAEQIKLTSQKYLKWDCMKIVIAGKNK